MSPIVLSRRRGWECYHLHNCRDMGPGLTPLHPARGINLATASKYVPCEQIHIQLYLFAYQKKAENGSGFNLRSTSFEPIT